MASPVEVRAMLTENGIAVDFVALGQQDNLIIFLRDTNGRKQRQRAISLLRSFPAIQTVKEVSEGVLIYEALYTERWKQDNPARKTRNRVRTNSAARRIGGQL